MSEVPQPQIDMSTTTTEAADTMTTERRVQINTLIDNAGIEREVYDFRGTQLIFVGREELPVIEGFENPTRLGGSEAPRFTDGTFTQSSESDPQKLLVNMTPLGFVEAALALGVQNDTLQIMQAELKSGIFSEQALNLIDTIVACHIVDGNGRVGVVNDTRAELLLLTSMLGDEAAMQDVQARLEALAAHDQAMQERSLHINNGTFEKYAGSETLEEHNLLLVRRTGHKPNVSPDGQVYLQSISEGTDRAGARSSIHFSLDFPVVSHADGNWEEMRYTVVATYGDVVEANGRMPQNLDPSDTWFNQNPGEVLLMPGAVVFEADITHSGEPTERNGIVVYNPKNSDISQLVAGVRESRSIKNNGTLEIHENTTYWTDKEKISQLRRYNLDKGIQATLHVETAQHMFETRLTNTLQSAKRSDDTFKDFLNGEMRIEWPRMQPVENLAYLLAHSPSEQRRTYYASGLALPRNPAPAARRKGI